VADILTSGVHAIDNFNPESRIGSSHDGEFVINIIPGFEHFLEILHCGDRLNFRIVSVKGNAWI
jgi:hypothetical protein